MKKWALFFALLLFFLVLSYGLRFQLLTLAGLFLIQEDPIEKAEVAFVLGGNAHDRGAKAAEVFKAGYVPQVVCLGGNVPSALKVVGKPLTSSLLTESRIESLGIPVGHVSALEMGTSTKEEAEAIFSFCDAQTIQKVLIISDKFHLRRVRYIFNKSKPDEQKLEIRYIGSASSTYDEKKWWASEEGLIMVNNEYAKLLYYFFVY